MEISPRTNVIQLIEAYPFIENELIAISDKFALLRNPVMRNTVGRLATLEQAAVMGGIAVDDLVAKLRTAVERSSPAAAAGTDDREQRQAMLLEIITDLHNGTPLAQTQKKFNEHFSSVSSGEIAAMEQALIAGGVPRDDVKRLCDVHVQVFKGLLDGSDTPHTPEGHPVNTFMLENRACENLLGKIEGVLKRIGTPPDAAIVAQFTNNLRTLTESLLKIDIHYLRKENQLFPQLEKAGITGPSQVMWALHDDIRAMIKRVLALLSNGQSVDAAVELERAATMVREMIYKEEHILFPMALEKLGPPQWDLVHRGEEEIGWAWIQPAGESVKKPTESVHTAAADGTLQLDTGTPTLEQVRLMLTHLPMDISFVNEKDEVVFYSANRDRIFPRSPGVIGRTVQNCHPPKSVGRVNEILEAFRAGQSDEATFWINRNNKFIVIKYVAVRDNNGKYAGCLEVTQDVTDIREMTGERRLLG